MERNAGMGALRRKLIVWGISRINILISLIILIVRILVFKIKPNQVLIRFLESWHLH